MDGSLVRTTRWLFFPAKREQNWPIMCLVRYFFSCEIKWKSDWNRRDSHSPTAATCFSSSQFAKKLTLRMKIKLKDSSPLAKLPIAKRKDKNRFWKTKLLHTHYTTRYIYRVIQPIRSWPTEPQKLALLSGSNVVSERGILIVDFLQWETNILTNCIIKICCTHWPA